MFERYLTDALTTHLGHIVQDLDADKIRISAWSGELVLKDIYLRSDALDHLVGGDGEGAPFEVSFGRIGHLEVRVPWKLIRSQLFWGSSQTGAAQQQHLLQQLACSVVLTDVNILVTPRRRKRAAPSMKTSTTSESGADLSQSQSPVEPDSSQQKEQQDSNIPNQQEESALDAEDEELLKKVQQSSKGSNRWQWILDRLVGIFSNLSVTVRNIHVRYEDPGTSMGFVWTLPSDTAAAQKQVQRYRNAFAIGITLREFSVLTEDKLSNDENGIVDEVKEDAATTANGGTTSDNGSSPQQQQQQQQQRSSIETESDRIRRSQHGRTPSTDTTASDSPALLPFQIRHKLVATQQLAAYWDSDCKIMAAVLGENNEEGGGEKAQYVFFDQAFGALNNDSASDPDSPRSSAFRSPHTFLLDPFSPSIRFALVAKNAVASHTQSTPLLQSPPSTMDISLPPCHFTISRNLLEDLGYLRKSFAVWTQAKKGVVSEAALRRLTQLRPVRSPLEDPRSWWKYAFEAVLLLRKLDAGSLDTIQQSQGKVASPDTSRHDVDNAGAEGQEDATSNGRNAGETPSDSSGLDEEGRSTVAWKTSLMCPEFSLQVNDRHPHFGRRPVAVVRLSCAFLQEQLLYQDGSWELTNRIGSLVVKDCTSNGDTEVGRQSIFPYLVAPRGRGDSTDDEKLYLNGVPYRQSAWVRLRRSTHGHEAGEEGWTTSTEVHILPMDFVYATAPVEALSRVLITANLELADDYHRMASRLNEWREGQKQRLIQALAHKQKRIIIDVDVGAPVLLIPEESRRDSPLLIIEFGRLKFHNEDKKQIAESVASGGFDQWRLEISDVQVQCSSTRAYRNLDLGEPSSKSSSAKQPNETNLQQVVEPFSLNFEISTRIQSEDDQSVEILATVPRLVFNMSSSAMRLILRLQAKWNERKGELQAFAFRSSRLVGEMEMYQSTSKLQASPKPSPRHMMTKSIDRRIHFRFVAPLLNFKFENDVDGRDCRPKSENIAAGTTLLVDLALRGIEGNILAESSSAGDSRLTYSARLRSLDAVDLYQRAGEEYALLLSSISPNLMLGRTGGPERVHQNLSSTDLVTFEYRSVKESAGLDSADRDVLGGFLDHQSSDTLSVQFHELYVEWNPETLAALQKAMRLPKESHRNESEADDSDGESTFYDAEEEHFHDADSTSSEEDTIWSLSEISSSRMTSFSDAPLEWEPQLPWESGLRSPVGLIYPISRSPPKVPIRLQPRKPFDLSFNLSKLRVKFNKESRHRALISVEMDRTSINYATRQGGGSKTVATIGNLTFSDCDSAYNQTLYREILGLQTDSALSPDGSSSLLELEMVTNPRSRRCVSRENMPSDKDDMEESVSVDVAQGNIQGCDSSLRVRFSPMRFVYLQQLWFEIIEYFFEGVIGNAVWGSESAAAAASVPLTAGVALQAEKISFTRFDILMDSPVILFPVTYCSTDFIRLEASAIGFANRYDCQPMRRPQPAANGIGSTAELQWYNNCEIKMTNLRLKSWSGSRLTQDEDSITGTINMNWPTGPTAPLNVPKWNVNCTFDAMYLYLLKEDYAVLQSVVQHNLGELSRHLDEWHALQSLPPMVLEQYKETIMVNFGYDKKDVTPTTFHVTVRLPLLCFSFRKDERCELAAVRCVDIRWDYKKLLDLVSQQQVACDVEIVGPVNGRLVEMLSSRRGMQGPENADGHADAHIIPGLSYSSTTQPSGDNSKTLEIVDGCIHVVYQVWRHFAKFFQGLPEPTYLSPEEVIQVGDRWYKIGGSPTKTSRSVTPHRLTWIAGSETLSTTGNAPEIAGFTPSYQFRLSLKRPSIVLASECSSLVLSMDGVVFHHSGQAGIVKRTISLDNVTFQTTGPGHAKRSGDISLVRPFSVSCSIDQCNGRSLCKCDSHSVRITAEIFKARVAYSDMSSAVDVCLLLIRDMKAVDTGNGKDVLAESPRDTDESDSLSAAPIASSPKESTVHFHWDGFEMAVVDDSGRHFAISQELVILSLGAIDFTRKKERVNPLPTETLTGLISGLEQEIGNMKYSMSLRFTSLTLIDCLQSRNSPFRLVVAIQSVPEPALSTASAGLDDGKYLSIHESPSFAVQLQSLVEESRAYTVRICSFALQYNPSMIIALQRFLGRLMKDVRTKAQIVFDESLEAFMRSPGDRHEIESSTVALDPMVLLASVEVQAVSICLNKEHQGRRLLQATLSDCQVNLKRTQLGSVMDGHVGDLSVTDPDVHGGPADDSNRTLLQVSCGSERFVKFSYQTFVDRKLSLDDTGIDIPVWVRSEVAGNNTDIDDCLDVSIGGVEVTLLRERTEELMDYLSNGMPGKGMGATSQAAKGFLKSRIRTRSFLQVHVDAPKVMIPQHEGVASGMCFRLGDLNVKSWIIENAERTESTRMLAVNLLGFSGGVYGPVRRESEGASMLSNVDMTIEVAKTKSLVAVTCHLSDVHIHLSYADYVLSFLVLRENLGRALEKKSWDNLEVAWEEEAASADDTQKLDSPAYSKEVFYSTNARHVRYGRKKESSAKEKPSYDFQFRFDVLSIILRRNDPLDNDTTQFDYDMVLVRGQGFEASLTSSGDGDQSLGFSLRSIFLYDLGGKGRVLCRSRGGERKDELPSAFSILVDGYSPPEKEGASAGSGNVDAQVIVTVNRHTSSPGDVKVSVLINYLSIAALARPFEEIVDFSLRKWPCSILARTRREETESLDGNLGDSLEDKSDAVSASARSFQVKFVLHYPRLILVADESDPHSRGLVVRGLAIVNSSFAKRLSVDIDSENEMNSGDEMVTSINADFQNISTYINPDVGDALGLWHRHSIILAEVPGLDTKSLEHREFGEDGADDFGVALLLPLTVNFEFEQVKCVGSKTTRSLGVNMDPLSAILSSEDIQLVMSMAKKWTSKGAPRHPPLPMYFYDVTFHGERLGLGLRKEGGQIVVDSVGQSVLLEHKGADIEMGDTLHSLNGKVVVNPGDLPLSTMVERLISEPRPLTIRFTRKSQPRDHVGRDRVSGSVTLLEPTADDKIYEGSVDSVDVALSAAEFTLVEKEIPLFRGKVSKTTMVGELSRTHETKLRFNLGSTIEVEYYNLRIWGWEPLLEPGGITLSATFQDPLDGPRELAIEVGDRIGSPLCLNITDGAAEALSKLKEWKKASDEGEQLDSPLFPEDAYSITATNRADDDRDGESLPPNRQTTTEANRFVARKAANAALSFARRQKSDTAKPFVFCNRTGVSIAFVRQKQGEAKIPVTGAHSFAAVGDYNGLQGYDDAEITVVGNGEEGKFRMDVLTDEITDGESHTRRSQGRFPFLTVAIQAVAGVTIEPLTDLPIFRASSTVIPMLFSRGDADEVIEDHSARHSVVWLVEQTDEKTILTLGSSIRFDCLSLTPIEVGAKEEGGYNRTLGIARRGIPFYFPLSLAMQQTVCHCSLRPVGQYHFAPLFRLLPDGPVETDETTEGCIECRPTNREDSSVWLAVMQHHDHEALEIVVDCCLAIRNLLPLSLDWEVAMDSPKEDVIVDGSTTRSWNLDLTEDSFLNSGEYAEVFSKGSSLLKARFRQRGGKEWSTWASLSIPTRPTATREGGPDDSDPVLIRHVSVNDAFGAPLTFGVRIIRKLCGLEVVVYAELWFKNCTSLPLAFGCVRNQLLGPQNERKIDTGSDDMSTAEAALKEISSLFETGEEGTGLRREGSRADFDKDIVILPGQVVSSVTEECFEYIEVDASTVKRRWWASEDPQSSRSNLTLIEDDCGDWHWLDKSWRVDTTGKTLDGWESSASVADFSGFSGRREFSPEHRFRRRRLLRRRTGGKPGSLVNGIEAFHQPLLKPRTMRHQEGKPERKEIRIAIQADGGKWELTSKTPVQGTVYGAIRTAGGRWPKLVGRTADAEDGSIYELCYYISPLDGDWGAFSRLMIVTSRFLLRNDSTRFVFEVKQTGAPDSTAQRIRAGGTSPFHWADFRLPELVSVRPAVEIEGRAVYRWSGGFDPLTIGAVPLRIRKVEGFSPPGGSLTPAMRVCSMKMEADIRPKTGKVGINLSFREEDDIGDGALLRLENVCPFPIWVAQDGILANPSRDSRESGDTDGDLLLPSDRMTFALDVPFRQGKYAGRKVATIAELLRLRLGLAPLSSRTGVETTKVVSFIAGEIVRLNPSKLAILEPKVRYALQPVRIIGIVNNDGPTRVLRFCLMKKTQVGLTFPNPFGEESMGSQKSIGPILTKEICAAAATTVDLLANSSLPTEDDVVNKAFGDAYSAPEPKEFESLAEEPSERIQSGKDMIISLRASFSGFVVSLVDSAPSEIAVLALRNVNALATWNTKRTTDATVYITITDIQVDNMVPNAPFPVAMTRDEEFRENTGDDAAGGTVADAPPLLVVGLSFAPKHKSGIVCLKSVTVAPRNLAIKVDLAFLVRLQKYALDLKGHFNKDQQPLDDRWTLPDINKQVNDLTKAGDFGVGSQTFYFGGLIILPCNIKLSVAPARALTQAQAALEGDELAAIHQAVRKGDVGLVNSKLLFGVKVGSRNATPLAVVRGVFKSFVVDAILCLDGASLNFAGVSLRNHISTGPKLSTHLGAHYLESLRQNLPALLGSLAVFGNPLGLVRGLGDGVSDFVLEPVKGFQKSVQEMDASYLVDGVARGTVSLARHTVGGFADSTAMLTETFSKNMTVLTLDRRYAQKRDRGEMLRNHGDVNVAVGFESGVNKLVQGFLEGVTGVVKAPIRGAEKRGFEGFAKGIGKGLLGLLVKPIIGISDGITDVMIGVKGSVDGGNGLQGLQLTHVRPRRPLYGRERAIRPYSLADAAAAALMLRTRLAGENYLCHVDMGDRVALLSVKRLLLLGPTGEEVLVLKFKHIDSLEVQSIVQEDQSPGWGIIVVLNTPRRNGSDLEVICCKEKAQADELRSHIEEGMMALGKELQQL